VNGTTAESVEMPLVRLKVVIELPDAPTLLVFAEIFPERISFCRRITNALPATPIGKRLPTLVAAPHHQQVAPQIGRHTDECSEPDHRIGKHRQRILAKAT
jgi:hypothetical protein